MSLRRPLGAAAALVLAVGLCTTPARAAEDLPFRDPGLPLAQRIDDLLGRLTLDEKISLLHQSQAAIPRLGVPYHKNGTEALHGVAWSNATRTAGRRRSRAARSSRRRSASPAPGTPS